MIITKFCGKAILIAKIKKGNNYLSPGIEIISDEALDLQIKEEF